MRQKHLYPAIAFFLLSFTLSAQTPLGCDVAAIRAAFAASGNYTELTVSGQSCSMYFLDNRSLDASQAEADANLLGAHMVFFNDSAENRNVVDALNTGGFFSGGNIWIGVKRVATANPQFYALDGSTGSFTPGPPTPGLFQNWRATEPNNNAYNGCFGGCGSPLCTDVYRCVNGEQCVQIFGNGEWNDLPCDRTSRSVIEVNLCPLVSVSNDTVVCAGGSKTIVASTILGSSPITHTWTPGNLTGASQNVTPAAPTSYVVTATDRYSCYSRDSVFVNIDNNCNPPPAPVGCDITAIRNAFAAFGARYAELPVTGQSCSMYFVDNNSLDAAQAESDANALGTHLVVFNDSAENSNVVAALNAGGYLSGGNPVWIGIKRVGTANPQFYALDGSTGNFNPGPTTPALFQNWAAGEPNNSGYNNCFGGCGSPFCTDPYKCNNGEQCVQIYSNGQWNDLACNEISKSVIEVNLCPLPRTVQDSIICGANPITLTTNTILGSQPYTFNWTPGPLTTPSITVTPPFGTTEYIVRATDRYSCYGEDTVNVTAVNIVAPVLTTNPNPPVICIGQSIDVDFVGVYSSYSTNWFIDGANLGGSSASLPYNLSWDTAGVKNVTLFITSQGCTSPTSSVAITVNPTPVAIAGSDTSICNGVNVNLGSASVPGITYQWLPSTGLSDSSISNPIFNFTNTDSVSVIYDYLLVVEDALGCIGFDSVRVTLYPDANSSFVINPANACINDNVSITYSGTNSSTATYNWNFGGATIVSGFAQGPYQVFWTTPGLQFITLDVSEFGCVSPLTTDSIIIGTPPVVNAGQDFTVCSGGSAQIGAPSVPAFTYSWDSASLLSDTAVSDPIFTYINTTPVQAIFTLILVVDSNGCKASDSITVTVEPPIASLIAPSGNPNFCFGTSLDLTNANTGLVSWQWSNGQTDTTITVFADGDYSLTGVDNANCIYHSDTILARVVPNPNIIDSAGGVQNESCSGYGDGSITVTSSVGQSPFTYYWSTVPPQVGNSIINLGPGQYSVTVSDSYLCTAERTFDIITETIFNVYMDSAYDISCFGRSDGKVYIHAEGGTFPYSYLWSNGYVTRGLSNVRAGTYTVTVTEVGGCTATADTTLTQPDEIVPVIAPIPELKYLDEYTIDLTVTPQTGYLYNWERQTLLNCYDCEDPIFTAIRTTEYEVTVIDTSTAFLCKAKTSVKIIVDASKRIYVPNVFTPNGDGANEEWQVYTNGVKYLKVEVFNRWGEMVYRNNNGIDAVWDGFYKGSLVQPGIYPYQLIVTYLDGEVIETKGTISIIR